MPELYDVFLSYAHDDRARVSQLRDELCARGIRVWMDETAIETFESITSAIETGLAASKVFLAFYSAAYPARRACQWELTAAFLAATRLGDPRLRVLVINPEATTTHIEPIELRDALFMSSTEDLDIIKAVSQRTRDLDGAFGDLETLTPPPWFVGRPAISSRFVGRVADMWEIHSGLRAGDFALITGAPGYTVVQMTGMGGIGKSLLAAEYALRFGASYPGGIFWLRGLAHDGASEQMSAEDRVASRDAQLLAFARDPRIGIETTGLSPDQLTGALAMALEVQHKPYLWIVDDLPVDVPLFELSGWLAPSGSGKTLLTTRSRKYESIGVSIELEVLSEPDGLELLAKHRQPDSLEERQAAAGLVSDLGGHALALDVAGAALKAELGIRTYAQWRTALAAPTPDELEIATHYTGELPSGHEPSVATTLARSIRRLDSPGYDFLRLASVLAAPPIPASLIVDVFALADEVSARAARTRAVEAMHEAQALSLADVADESHGSRQVHGLVSRTMMLLERESERTAVLTRAAILALINDLSESVPARLSREGTTVAHARHLANPAVDLERIVLLGLVAQHDSFRADYRSARINEERVVDWLRLAVGEEHPITLIALNNLATTMGALGDVKGYRALIERVASASTRVLGKHDPDTLTALSNLAQSLSDTGDLGPARALQEEVLELRRVVLGEDHPNTLLSMDSLAGTVMELGDIGPARALYEQVVGDSTRALGKEHPATLLSMSNLAAALSELGAFDSARALELDVLQTRRRVLGNSHPETLTSINNLAETYRSLGDLETTRRYQEEVVAALSSTLGDEHPDTLTSRGNLAGTMADSGDLVGARADLDTIVEASRRVLGDQHPSTLRSMGSLAAVSYRLGDRETARDLLVIVVGGRRRVLGDDHPDTQKSTTELEVVTHELNAP
jgi:hypothetical protein